MSPRAWLDARFLRKTSSSNEQIDALDGLRGIAVAFVVASHLSNLDLHVLPYLDLRSTGKYGVYLFFVLSAFLLTRPFVAADVELGDSAQWRRYAIRRVLRIFPLYWTVLAVNWFFTEVAPTEAFPTLSTERLVRHLLLQEGKGVYWTIPVELTYYLAIPLFALLVRALRGRIALVTLAVVGLIGATAAFFPPSETPHNSLDLRYYLAIFVCGSYAAFLDQRLPAARAAVYDVLAMAGFLAVLASTPALVEVATGSPADIGALQTRHAMFGVAWSAVVLGVLRGRSPLASWLASPALRIVGVVSFSIYLWHVPILRALAMLRLPQPQLTAWLVIVASLAVALASYLAFEKPFVHGALGRRLTGRSR